ncbi:MAG: M56 family metallopeptidase, partial [Planctomycetota bacterium]
VILLIQNLVSAFFWFHPLVKMLNRQLAQAREEVCDNYVLVVTDANSYSRTLLTLASLIQSERLLPGTIGLFTSRWKLEHRIAGLLDQQRSRSIRLSSKKLLCLLALSLCMTAGIAGGTITLAVAQMKSTSAADPSPIEQNFSQTKHINETQQPGDKPAPTTQSIIVRGTITTHKEKPAAGALVAVFGLKSVNNLKPKRELLGESVADKSGYYELTLPGGTLKTYTGVELLARTEQSGVSERKLDLTDDQITIDLKLPLPLYTQIRFVDPEGQPAADLPVRLMNYTTIPISEHSKPLSERRNRPRNLQKPVTDMMVSYSPGKINEQGLLKLSIFDLRNGVTLNIPGTEKFAPQWIRLNSDIPEERGKDDETYRDIVKNVKPGEDTTIVLAPARIFAGTVLLGDSGQPAANTRIKIWASQQEKYGSMVSVEGKTDEAGRFRLNPQPGVRFGIIAYPPQGTPYLTRELKDLRWSPGAASNNIEVKLNKVVLAEGTVIDASTGKPLQGAAVQYYPERTNDKRLLDDIVSGWQSIQKTDAAGQFQIPVLPGPGTLLVHATEKNYILQERDSQQLHSGKPGGARMYAHAFQKINSAADDTLKPMNIELQPGTTIAGTLVDEQGQAIKHAIMISRLKLDPTSPDWRGFPDEVNNGTFELHGLREGVDYPVYFLDPKNRLGAAAKISVGTQEPKIVLKPCGSATARFVDLDGKPIAEKSIAGLYLVVTPGTPKYDFQAIRSGALWADEELVFNIDRVNYSSPSTYTTNAKGEMTFPALIPGASYRSTTVIDGQPKITHEFTVQPGERFDMGDIEIQIKE